jgi:SAM-dependent methyltransferase
MTEQIKKEEGVHGTHWNAVHGGYFSDPMVAAPLVQKIKDLAGKSRTEVIVDLGGGTGFLLSQLLVAGVEPGVSLVNLDDSTTQLDFARETGVSCIRGSVGSFLRREVGPQEGRFLFIMRSVLHYFGEDGLRPVLRHLRAQAKPGECFVHQTASFCRRRDANCLNELYKMMGTQKWYPTVDFLCECLRAEGWQVLEVLPVLPLQLTCDDLMQRYHLDQKDVLHIRDRLSQNSLVSDEVFKKTDDGFCAFLHYWIYVCTAAVPENSTMTTDRNSL